MSVKICSTVLKQLLSKINISQTLKRQYDRCALIIFTVAWSFPPYIPNTYSVISSESLWNLFSVNIQSPQRKKQILDTLMNFSPPDQIFNFLTGVSPGLQPNGCDAQWCCQQKETYWGSHYLIFMVTIRPHICCYCVNYPADCWL